MKCISHAIKTFNWKLWIAIFITNFLPAIYQTVRIYILGSMPSDTGLNIASQLQWVNLFYEVIQEALILPLFYLLGKSLNNFDTLSNKVRTGLMVTFSIYTLSSSILILSARPLVILMAQEGVLVDKTVTYVRLETIAALLATLWRFMILVLITIKKEIYLYLVLGAQMLLSITLDTVLISDLSISFKLGVNGIAITNIIVNFFLLSLSIYLLNKEAISLFKLEYNFLWLNEWFKVGKYSGIESFLRNLVFMVMIVRMMNVVAEQHNYWVANNFIWNWLLLPTLALADLVKKEIAEDKNSISTKTFGYIIVASLFAILWLASIPLWKLFFEYFMNIKEYKTVYSIVLTQTGFYITFLFNNSILDSTFYGLGLTHYMLIQSICIDLFYYGIMFILYVTEVFKPNLLSISLMFGIGLTLDFIPTLVLYIRLLRKENLYIQLRNE